MAEVDRLIPDSSPINIAQKSPFWKHTFRTLRFGQRGARHAFIVAPAGHPHLVEIFEEGDGVLSRDACKVFELDDRDRIMCRKPRP